MAKKLDTIIVIQQTLNQVLLSILTQYGADNPINLKYLSEGWEEKPYWYFWFNCIKGAYRLELSHAEEKNDGWVAGFRVKYYPDPTEKCFSGLAPLERECRKSHLFNVKSSIGTCECIAHSQSSFCTSDAGLPLGVPNYYGTHLIPPDFFYIGDILVWSGHQFITIGAESYDRWLVTVVDESAKDGSNLYEAVDRDFPGWELTSFFAERLAVIWQIYNCFTLQANPVFTNEGFKFVVNGQATQLVLCQEIHKINEWWLLSADNTKENLSDIYKQINDWSVSNGK
ncbi:hypothetical protein SOV_32360 [Sporomusa ovata DSM 2662]|uniref:Uncharacterized protein n=1 Tax=Sporomusa ovata TaxID=2378 RepID=A0A0U1L248_9FIRM|nr:hypothetical protein [Sporomusa ovata]EQB25191.1 hypothetical protein SOV_5c03410 [Sporomusa ovata DSM 2662]CQR73750.1 hypothetical protein SpAn4DRAFT_0212 [Sporomusa ovata]